MKHFNYKKTTLFSCVLAIFLSAVCSYSQANVSQSTQCAGLLTAHYQLLVSRNDTANAKLISDATMALVRRLNSIDPDSTKTGWSKQIPVISKNWLDYILRKDDPAKYNSALQKCVNYVASDEYLR